MRTACSHLFPPRCEMFGGIAISRPTVPLLKQRRRCMANGNVNRCCHERYASAKATRSSSGIRRTTPLCVLGSIQCGGRRERRTHARTLLVLCCVCVNVMNKNSEERERCVWQFHTRTSVKETTRSTQASGADISSPMPVTGPREPPNLVARAIQWSKWIDSEKRINTYQAATERQQFGFDKLKRGCLPPRQASLPKLTGSDLTRLLQPGLDHTSQDDASSATPSVSDVSRPPLAPSASHHSLTAASQIHFPGLGGGIQHVRERLDSDNAARVP